MNDMVLVGSFAAMLLMAMPVDPSVLQDLNSPVYAVREKARETLRANFHQTAPEAWKELVDSLHLHKGESVSQVTRDCDANGIPLFLFQEDGTVTSHLHVDEGWALVCDVRGDVLETFSLSQTPSGIANNLPPVLRNDPPPHFTGLWRTYREDGQRVSEIYYVSGIRGGPLSDGGMGRVPPLQDRTMTIHVETKIETGTKTSK
jgi:hypothetical protein